MIGRNNQEEEDGCENQVALSVLRDALRPELGRGRGEAGGERNQSVTYITCTPGSNPTLASEPPHSQQGLQSKDYCPHLIKQRMRSRKGKQVIQGHTANLA